MLAASIALVACSAAGCADSSAVAHDASAGAPAAASPGGGLSGDRNAGGGHGSAASGSADCPTPVRPPSTPRRVVTLDGGAAGLLLRLGLLDRVVATAGNDFFAAYPTGDRTRLNRIPLLSDRLPNREQVIAERPDLVLGTSTLELGGFPGTPTARDLSVAGIPVVVACAAPTGTRVRDLAPTWQFIRDTARAFGVEQRGEALITQLGAEIAPARALFEGRPPVRTLVLSAAPAAGQSIGTIGGGGLANGIVSQAGGANIFADLPGDSANVNLEEVVARDPEAIVAITFAGSAKAADLVSAILASPQLARITAVRERRIVTVSNTVFLSPSPLNGQAVTMVGAALHRSAR